MEQRIVDEFENASSALLYRGETIRKMKKVIQRAFVHDIRKDEKYELMTEMKSLVGFIKDNESKEYGPRYELNIGPGFIVGGFMKSKENLINRCIKLDSEI